jgi:hypothetical protein
MNAVSESRNTAAKRMETAIKAKLSRRMCAQKGNMTSARTTAPPWSPKG